jgi:hypothetical protein
MATMTLTKIRAFAFCPDARCPGNATEEVDAVCETTELRYSDLGGDMPADPVERSTEHLRFADEALAPCPAPGCKRFRDLSRTDRVAYQATGYDPLGLLHVKVANAREGGNDMALAELLRQQNERMLADAAKERDKDAELGALKAQLAALSATLAAALEPVEPDGPASPDEG